MAQLKRKISRAQVVLFVYIGLVYNVFDTKTLETLTYTGITLVSQVK